MKEIIIKVYSSIPTESDKNFGGIVSVLLLISV